MNVLDTATRLQRAGQPCALVTVISTVSPISARPGDKAVVTPDGHFHGWVGGGCAQRFIVRAVRAALADGQPRRIRVVPETEASQVGQEVEEYGSSCPSGGRLEFLIDPLLPRPQLLVLGDSPVAAWVCSMASQVGFEVILAARDADPGTYPDAASVLPSFEVAAIRQQLRPSAFVVVATQGMLDSIALHTALALDAGHVGFVASARKAAALRQELLGDGLPATQVEQIQSPAGLAIDATTPAEIALSIVAELVMRRRAAPTLAAVSQPVLAEA